MTALLRILVIMVTGLAASTAGADTLVRSGEHATFTRLVLYLPGPADAWSTENVEGGYLVDMAPVPSALDTADVFSFIPRNRISDVALRDGKVWIASTCDCHISVFRARPDAIAIDVRDGPDPTAPTTAPQPVLSKSRAAFPVLFDPPAENTGATWLVEPRVAFLPPGAEPEKHIDSTALATEIARAASGGLLRPNAAGPALDGPGIEMRSALDSARKDRSDRMQTALCSNMAQLDNLTGMTAPDAWRVIDNASTGQTLEHRAMAYLALGFGAEAAADFATSELSPDKAILLAQVAHFIDTPDRPAPRNIQSAASCGGVAALLAVLGTPGGAPIAEPQGLAAVNALSRLPFPLRAHLAGYLETRLRMAGHVELAQSADFARLRATDAPEEFSGSVESAVLKGYGEAAFSGRANLPQTAFFRSNTSEPIYDAIAAGRFAPEDRILIEAWIKEAPSAADADAASAFYVGALNTAARPLDALAHLDMRFGRRGLVSPGLQTALVESVETAMSALGPGELLVLGARLPQRPWFKHLPDATRIRFEEVIGATRTGIMGAPSQPQPGLATDTGFVAQSATDPPTGTVTPATASPRRIAAEAAIATATDSLSQAARLRAEATEKTAEWARNTRQ